MALSFIRFNKKPIRQFSIPYRYYDPEQERRDEREQRIRHELEMEQIAKDPSSYRSAIKGSFRAHRKSVALGKGSENNRTVKIILIVFILSMLGYMIFFR